jgi:hypothetical protein
MKKFALWENYPTVFMLKKRKIDNYTRKPCPQCKNIMQDGHIKIVTKEQGGYEIAY